MPEDTEVQEAPAAAAPAAAPPAAPPAAPAGDESTTVDDIVVTGTVIPSESNDTIITAGPGGIGVSNKIGTVGPVTFRHDEGIDPDITDPAGSTAYANVNASARLSSIFGTNALGTSAVYAEARGNISARGDWNASAFVGISPATLRVAGIPVQPFVGVEHDFDNNKTSVGFQVKVGF